MATRVKDHFLSDPRKPCKYGATCYRTNKDHLDKYKHPSTGSQKEVESPEILRKKQKLSDSKPNGANSPSAGDKETKSQSPKKIANVTPTQKNNTSSTRVLLRNKTRTADSKRLELESDLKELIKQIFLVEMPDDFFSFWEMCETLCKNDPTNALKDVKLKLVGPFDVLAGRITDVYEEDKPDLLRHWRYYYDPPEFQTVLCCQDSRCFHFGYYRDDPNQTPVFVASNSLITKNPEKNGELKLVGPNLFAALNSYLEELKTDPFSRMKVPKFQKVLNAWAKEKNFCLEKSSKEMDARSRQVVAKTFHGAGIVVPVDKKNDVGYRELAASNAMIKKMLKGIAESESEEERKTFWAQLQPVITFANIANDECDFGTSLELGLDLFTFGSPLLHQSVRQLLTTAYQLLGREHFATIIQAHLEDRKQGGSLSVL